MHPLVAFVLALALTAPASVPLPKPTGSIPVVPDAFPDRPERLRTSIVPGPVDDDERLTVLLAPSGAPAAVTMTQRLTLRGTGQFVVWERSSAQDVEALEDTVAPVLKREAVIWQGFVDGSKPLVARLTLDPAVEAELLPLSVTLTWNGAGAIGPGGSLPGAGEVTVRVSNRTARAMTLPTGTAAARDLAGPLDALLAFARARRPGAPPMAGRGLPLTVPGTVTGSREATTVAPFRLRGTIRVYGGAPVSEPSGAVTHVPDGLRVDGVLQGDVEFTIRAAAASALRLDLAAFPTVDERVVTPPHGRTWAEWLRRGPQGGETEAAFRTLVETAAAAARTDEYAPYLGHHGKGAVRTTYAFRMAPASAVRVVAPPLRPRPWPIALASLAFLAILANTTAIWRRL
jgi:hypothetical protein